MFTSMTEPNKHKYNYWSEQEKQKLVDTVNKVAQETTYINWSKVAQIMAPRTK